MSGDCRPVGFFDSGVGGISVLKTAFIMMPNENYIYYGDSLNAPYGEKTEGEIKSLSLSAGRFLFDKGVKAIVIACNTATSAAVMMMREEFNIPVISMEPAVRPALNEIKHGKALVLATAATVSQERYLSLLERLNAGDRVVSVGCSGLVELVEEGKTSQEDIDAYFEERLCALKDLDIEAVVIGCTHYSFVSNEIKRYIDKAFSTDCRLFDGKEGTVRQLKHILSEKNMTCGDTSPGSIQFFVSGHHGHIDRYKTLFEHYQP